MNDKTSTDIQNPCDFKAHVRCVRRMYLQRQGARAKQTKKQTNKQISVDVEV